MDKKRIGYVALVVASIWMLLLLTAPPMPVNTSHQPVGSNDFIGEGTKYTTKYSEIRTMLLEHPDTIKSIQVTKNLINEPDTITVVVVTPEEGRRLLYAVLPSSAAEAELRDAASKYSIDYSALNTPVPREIKPGPSEVGGGFFGLSLGNIIMIAIFGTMLYLMWQQYKNGPGGGGANKFGKSKHKKFEPEKGVVKFADVAGLDETQEDLELLVEFLKDPSEVKGLDGKIAKATLLVGPPGTGKTLIAKAVAGEAGVPAFYINAAEFVEMYVGVGAARVRDMFEEIRKTLPCILIIDELDAVAQHRGTGIGGGNDERQQTINQLLSEMDGFEDNEGLIVFGLTNRPDVLDPAIVRSGRFGDRRAIVGLPDKKARREIIDVHARGLSLDTSVDLDYLAQATSGLSGADIAAILKVHGPHFAIKRTRDALGKGAKAKTILMEDLDQGIAQIHMGGGATNKKSKRLSDGVKKLLAYHELGHALVGEYLHRANGGWADSWHDPAQKVTIIGAGGAGGYTLFQGEEDPFCMTREQLLGQITSLVAANRAEQKYLGTTSTGAQNDIERAYDLAKKMVTKWGMSPLGMICVGGDDGSPFLGKAMSNAGAYGLGPKSSNQIDHQIRRIEEGCILRAEKILDAVESAIHFMAPILINEETFLRDRFLELWSECGIEVDSRILVVELNIEEDKYSE